MFSGNYIDQSICDFFVTEGILEALAFWPFDPSRLQVWGDKKT